MGGLSVLPPFDGQVQTAEGGRGNSIRTKSWREGYNFPKRHFTYIIVLSAPENVKGR